MRYGQIRPLDIANGPGIRVSLFVTGCTHNCKGCFNQEYQNFRCGKIYTENETEEIINYLSKPNIKGFSLLGGEPFQNVEGLLEPIKKIRQFIDRYNFEHKEENSFTSHKDIWVYSGYTYEELIKDPIKKQLLSYCDVLIDGKFVEELLDLKLKFRGSSNQRIIDIQKSFNENKIILNEKYQ